jgi:hypothetical protein
MEVRPLREGTAVATEQPRRSAAARAYTHMHLPHLALPTRPAHPALPRHIFL